MKFKYISLLQRVLSSKDGKTLANNFSYLMLLKIASYVFPLITIPYLAKTIGVEGFGKIAFAAAIIVWFQTIADWGFNYTATRDVARNRDDLAKVSIIFSNTLWARILLMFVSFLVLIGMIYLVPYFKEYKQILLVTFLLIPGNILFPDWFFQAMERMKYITIFNLVSKALLTILVFVFIKEKSDYILQPLLISLGYLMSGICAMYIILVRWKVKIYPPNLYNMLKAIKGSTDVFINNLLPNFYKSFSNILLGVYSGSIANGLFDAGNKFSEISQQFMTLISRVFFPYLSRKSNNHDLYAKLNLIISMTFFIILFTGSPLIIKTFYTEEFYEAIPILRILSFSIIFSSLTLTYGTNYMIIKGHEKELRNITLITSIIGFLISFPLIYHYGAIGAAITVTLSRAISGINVMRKAKALKLHDVKYI